MQRIVDIALSRLGYKESPKGSNMTDFGQWFGLNGRAWCGMFVSWCYDQAEVPLGTIDFRKGFAGTQFALKHFIKKDEVISAANAKPGDIVLFDWNGDERPDHTGIFKQDLGNGTFECVEGNTAVGNNSDGGEVMLRIRPYTAGKMKLYFVHPKVLDKERIAA